MLYGKVGNYYVRSPLWVSLSTLASLCVMAAVANGQLNVIHQEGFNDDGDGDRYTMKGRGTEPNGSDGPGAWEHSFLVDAIGLPSTAIEKRAAVLWTDVATEDDYTEASLQVWDNLINYMLDGKENATIGFLPSIVGSANADFMSFRLEDAGHAVIDVGGDLPPADDVDLIIHTSGANPPSPTAFVTYPVPVITYNAGNHDDTLVSSIGAVTTAGPATVTILDVEHPVLEGVARGDVQWIDDFIAEEPLQGIGAARPPSATVLATYVDPASEAVLPAVMLIEKDQDLLGAFAPVPEGEGYIIGGDLNLDFGEGPASETDPVAVTLNPVDVSAETGVKLSVDLAATTVDFEAPDFVRVLYAPDENDEFVELATFDGLAGSLVHPDLGALNAEEFSTFTFEIPDEATNLVVRVEAFSTFPNEVLGVDNIVIFTGELPTGHALDCTGEGDLTIDDVACATPENLGEMLTELNRVSGDFDLDGDVDFDDFVTLSNNFGNEASGGVYANGDSDLNGAIDFDDFVTMSNNFGSMAAAAAQVPEPSTFALLSLALVSLVWRRPR